MEFSQVEPSPFAQVGSSKNKPTGHQSNGSWDYAVTSGRTSLGGRASHDSVVGFSGLYPSLAQVPQSEFEILNDLQQKLRQDAGLKVFSDKVSESSAQWSRPLKIACSVPLVPTDDVSSNSNPFDLKWTPFDSDDELSNIISKYQSQKIRKLRLYLIRHGETAANQQRVLQGSGIDQDLNETGFRQSDYMASYIFETVLKLYLNDGELLKSLAIVSSHLKRAVQTAGALNKHFKTKLNDVHAKEISHTILPEVREISWGDWEGKSDPPGLAELIQRWTDGDFEAKSIGPGSESPMDCIRRTIPAIFNLLKKHFLENSKDVVVVTHGRLIRVVLAYLLSSGDLYQMPKYHHVNTCINCLDIYELQPDENGKIEYLFIPLTLNDHSHLQDLILQSSATTK